nr:hypothetical protein BCU22_05565 [Vibrio cyclitrophicus]
MLRPSRQDRYNLFFQKETLKYGELYDFSKIKYINGYTPVEILCPKLGAFHTTPKTFLTTVKKIGCPLCCCAQKVKHAPQKTNKNSGCGTDKFNVRGGTKKYQHLLLKVFE